jgi:hypothetical protein
LYFFVFNSLEKVPHILNKRRKKRKRRKNKKTKNNIRMAFIPYTNECPTPYTEDTGQSMVTLFPVPLYFHMNPWSSSGICNIVNVGASLQFEMSSQVIQLCTSIQNNNIVTDIECNSGDNNTGDQKQCNKVVISNNTYYMSNRANMTAAQASYKSNDAQYWLYKHLLLYMSTIGRYMLKFPSTLPSTTSKNTTLSNVINAFFRLSVSMNTNIEQTCTSRQHNVIDLYVKGYNNVIITNNKFKQTNSANMKCTQLALEENIISQQLATILQAMGSVDPTPQKSPRGIFGTMMICLIFFIVCVGIIQVGKSLQPWPPALCLFFGFIFIALFCIMKFNSLNVKSSWFAYSPGIESIPNYNDYFELDKTDTFTTADEAQAVCDSNPSYVAMDYTIDPLRVAIDPDTGLPTTPGTAKFYKGNPTQTMKACESIISNMELATSPQFINYRHAYFRNGNLGGKVPDESIIGDVCLDVDEGKLWFRIPYESGSGFHSYQGQTSSWVEPSKLYEMNQDNVRAVLIDAEQDVAEDARFYFYIDPSLKYTEALEQQLYLDDRYVAPLDCNCNTLNSICSETNLYSVDDTTGKGNNFVKAGDYFVLPFPSGPDVSGEQYEQYDYNQKFGVFPVRYNSETSKWEPDTTITYTIFMNGYGLVPIIQSQTQGDSHGNEIIGSTSTYLKYEQVFYALLWLGLGFIGISILMVAWIYLRDSVYYNKSSDEIWKGFSFFGGDSSSTATSSTTAATSATTTTAVAAPTSDTAAPTLITE